MQRRRLPPLPATPGSLATRPHPERGGGEDRAHSRELPSQKCWRPQNPAPMGVRGQTDKETLGLVERGQDAGLLLLEAGEGRAAGSGLTATRRRTAGLSLLGPVTAGAPSAHSTPPPPPLC